MAGATVVPEAAAVPLPDGVDPAVAALIGCCVSTGVGAVIKTAEVPAGASVAVIGLGGVGLSCVMGAASPGRPGSWRSTGWPAKIERRPRARRDGRLLAGDAPSTTLAALRKLTDGGPDFVFEAIGRPATVELAVESLPLGGTAVLVGMTPVAPAPHSRSTRSSTAAAGSSAPTTGSRTPAIDFPRYAELHLDGRLPIDRLIDRRIALDDVEAAFDRLRAGDGLRQVIVFDYHFGPAGTTRVSGGRCPARTPARVQTDATNPVLKFVDLPGSRLPAPSTDRLTSRTPARPSYSVTATAKLVIIFDTGS